MIFLINLFAKIFYADISQNEMYEILSSIIDGRISCKQWDAFTAVKIIDKNLNEIRLNVQGMWIEHSEYYNHVKGEVVNPTHLNSKGISEIIRLRNELNN